MAFKQRIEAYFEDCETRQHAPVICGLAVWLDMTREGLCDYGKKPLFADIVKRAKDRIQANVERLLLEGKSAVGAIFWLKNHAGYADRQEHEHHGPGGAPLGVIALPAIDTSKPSPTEETYRKDQEATRWPESRKKKS